MSSPRILWVHVGDARHGVHRFGRVLAQAGAGSSRQLQLIRPDDLAALEREEATDGRPDAIVVQFTDRQWGPDPEAAADRFGALAALVGRDRLVVGLHDLPEDGDERRRGAYADVARSAERLVVCSHHERRRLERASSVSATVIPHPVELVRPRTRACRQGRAAVVLGFVYPGKGHADVIEASGRASTAPPILALGGPAPGHGDLVAELRGRAAALGVTFDATGWLPDSVLERAAARASIPVVPNCAPSASGSLASWIGAGRRPLVRDGEYAREVADLVPEGVHLYPGGDPDALAARLDAAARTPGATLGSGPPDWLRPERIAACWARIAGC